MKLFIPAFFLISAGLLELSSISNRLFFLQLAWVAVGLVLLWAFRSLQGWGVLREALFIWGVYSIAIILLVVTLFVAPVIRNTQSWIVLGPFSFQPVELAKLALILVFANYFSKRHLLIARAKHIFASFAIFAVPK